MVREVIYTTVGRAALRRNLAAIPAMLAGEVPDRLGLARGFALRLAVAFLSRVKQAFIIKSRGGTDEAGIKWPPLTPEYLAYGRGPFSTRRAGKSAPGKVRGGDRDGQQKDGFLSKKQMALWRAIYAQNLKWLAARHGLEDAKGRAAAIAWKQLKDQGARTKLAVFGSRNVPILHDYGTLFNSLSPGVLSEAGADASYTPTEAQVVEVFPGGLAVGSNVEYAKYHQGGTRRDHSEKGRGAIRRQLWPEPDQMPASWNEFIGRKAASGIPVAIRLIAAGAFGRE